MKNSEIKNIIEIEGIILTDAAIAEIKELQWGNNEEIDINRDMLANTICFITRMMVDLDDDELKEAININIGLSVMRIAYNNFKKP